MILQVPVVATIALSLCCSQVTGYTEIVPSHVVTNSAVNAAPFWNVFPDKKIPMHVKNIGHDTVAVLCSDGALYFGTLDDSDAVAWSLVTIGGAETRSKSARNMIAMKSTPEFVQLAMVHDTNVEFLHCTTMKLSCEALRSTPLPIALKEAPNLALSNDTIWIASDQGLYAVSNTKNDVEHVLVGHFINAVSNDVGSGLVLAGNAEKIWIIDGTTHDVVRWEWVTDEEQMWGGVIDGPIQALAIAPSSPPPRSGTDARGLPTTSSDVFIGTPVCLNMRDVNGAFARVGADQGLPVGNITALAFALDSTPSTQQGSTQSRTTKSSAPQLWIGTSIGVAVRSAPLNVANMTSPVRGFAQQQWRYLHGPRWLAGNAVAALTVVPRARGGDTIVVVHENGMTFLHQQQWTLARKAAVFDKIALQRHNRHGMSAECLFDSFGKLDGCVQMDSDNNGLWTSLLVVAEYMRYHVTGDEAALSSASRYFSGLALLNNVTGKPGLMARSCCDPTELLAGCGAAAMKANPKQWHNSSDEARFRGWMWKGDTSSDETTGHVFGLSVVANLSPLEWERTLAKKLLLDFVAGVVKNDYMLIDVTGNATTWGRWSPHYVNDFRPFSDERGLQALQMLAYLSAAANLTARTDAAGMKMWLDAYADLTNATNQYLENVVNAKIDAPCDDNYSDDELMFLPFFSLLTTCTPDQVPGVVANSSAHAPESPACPFPGLRKAGLTGLARAWRIIRPERSDLWAMMNHACVSAQTEETVSADVRDDVVWNLQTWSLDLIEWPVSNTARQDIFYERGANRFGKTHVDSTKTRSPLPANERTQSRWNANPYEVGDGGDGMSEQDPGAWLLPYWMGRFYGILSEHD
eukprot:m.1553094 g.1553094  ORF g.1553094 m.1553094 type:complete len:862 (+) comp25268_c1_seq3:151-2736(+)